ETILKGNQKVLSARLSDAKFFWENDLRTVQTVGLEGMAAGLALVTFHNKLGSQADRIARIEVLARKIAPLLNADEELAAEAARIAKADLQSAMVGEFPELQGTMGGYYARAIGRPEEVAAASRAHYSPLGPTDGVPSAPVTIAVALSDKLDTLTGFWLNGLQPTGSSDPFALRRAVLGVSRLIIENGIRLELSGLLGYSFALHDTGLDILNPNQTFKSYDAMRLIAKADLPSLTRDQIDLLSQSGVTNPDLRGLVITYANLLSFFHDRLKVYLRDQGIRHDVIDACLAMPGNDDLTLLVKRAEALAGFLKTDDGTNLLQGFKRANNILSQAEAKDGVEYSFGADEKFAETDAERALFTALDGAEAVIRPAMREEDFAAAMTAMASLRAPIDAFFEAVQVNAENPILRRNRLNLLHRIRAICGQVADLTKVEG
ncbi:MAG: glycine--tRNA ligase subunit beta, partial [Cereibacter changlensis]